MSETPFKTGGPTKQRRPAMRGIVMLDVCMGTERVRVWPKKRGKAKTAEAKKLQDDFRQASWATKYWDPRNTMSVNELRKGTPVLTRDLQIMMMYNRFAHFSTVDGRQIYSMQARQDVSDSLDTISPLPGSMLVRTNTGWRYVAPPALSGMVLTSTGVVGTPAEWNVLPPAPSAGALQQLSSRLLGSAAASVTFSAIDQSYNDLIIVAQCRFSAASGASELWLQFNGDTGANYWSSRWNGFGRTNYSGQSHGTMGDVNNNGSGTAWANVSEATVHNYAHTIWKKKWVGVCDADLGETSGTALPQQVAGMWNNAAAINSITLAPTTGNFVAGSFFRLYGRN